MGGGRTEASSHGNYSYLITFIASCPMPKSVSLGEHLERFIAEQVAKGGYNNGSEVVRAGLRLLEKYELELSELRALIDEGDRDYAGGRYAVVEDTRALAEEIARESGTARGGAKRKRARVASRTTAARS